MTYRSKHNRGNRKPRSNVSLKHSSSKPQGILPFEREFNPKDLPKIAYSRSELDPDTQQAETISIELPKWPLDGSREQLLHVVQLFLRAAENFHWNDNGAKLFHNFGNQLEDTTEWDRIARHIHQQTPQEFDVALHAFLGTQFPADAWQQHKTMLHSTTKPFKMSPQTFVGNLQRHNSILPLLPGAPPEAARMSEAEMKEILLEALPEQYQKQFRDAGYSTSNGTLADIVYFMDALYDSDEKVQAQLNRPCGAV